MLIYKSNEGRLMRLLFFVMLTVIVLFGLYTLYGNFPQWEWANSKWNITIPGFDSPTDMSSKLAACIGIGFIFLFFWGYLCFKNPNISEWLIKIQNSFLGGYKTKQGQIVRWGFFLVSCLLFLFGCYRLYFTFSWFGWERANEPWFIFALPLVEITIKITPALITSLAVALFFIFLFTYLYFKNDRISDFLIDTESEMRKVSWPTMGDVVKSSMAVVFIIVLLGVYLFGVDILLDGIFAKIFKL